MPTLLLEIRFYDAGCSQKQGIHNIFVKWYNVSVIHEGGMKSMDSSKLILIEALVIMVFLFLLAFIISAPKRKRFKRLRRYLDIQIGMSEQDMLDIMGDGYSRSLLKDNRIKYDWRVTFSNYNSSTGVGSLLNSGVSVYTKDGYVEEVKPYNIA